MSRTIDIIDELTDYLIKHGRGRLPEAAAERQWLYDYVALHLSAGNLIYCRDPVTREIAGLGIGWRCNESEVNGKFEWQPKNVNGDSFYFATVVTSRPYALLDLFYEWTHRCRDCLGLKLLSYKRGKLKRLKIDKFIRKLPAAINQHYFAGQQAA